MDSRNSVLREKLKEKDQRQMILLSLKYLRNSWTSTKGSRTGSSAKDSKKSGQTSWSERTIIAKVILPIANLIDPSEESAWCSTQSKSAKPLFLYIKMQMEDLAILSWSSWFLVGRNGLISNSDTACKAAIWNPRSAAVLMSIKVTSDCRQDSNCRLNITIRNSWLPKIRLVKALKCSRKMSSLKSSTRCESP